MGREKGMMGQMSRRLEFGISPYEQKIMPAKGFFDFIPNTLRRMRRSAWIAIPGAFFYQYMAWLNETHEKLHVRKRPEDFENDE